MKNTLLPFLARLFLSGLFFYSGYKKLADPSALTLTLTEKGMPMPDILAWIVIVTELIFPIMIVIGLKTRFAAIGLIIWLLPVTFIMHPLSDPKQIGSFLKNFTIVGGLLLLHLNGPGAWAIDRENLITRASKKLV